MYGRRTFNRYFFYQLLWFRMPEDVILNIICLHQLTFVYDFLLQVGLSGMIKDTSLKMLHHILKRTGVVASLESGSGYVEYLLALIILFCS